jgi:glycosyltransferase involved in cell wall biosynthesis
MRVVVDARQVYRPQRRGIGKTLIHLYRTLAVRRPAWRFLLVHQAALPVPELAGLPNLSHRSLDLPGVNRLDLWERAALPGAALVARADLIHAPANTGPPFAPAPVVVNVHDLIPYEMAPTDPAARRWLRRVARVARAARHVLTGSEYSKRRITDVLGLPPAKVTVNPWAPDRNVHRVDDPAAVDRVRVRHGLRPGEPYLFGFGADDPRKNTRRVIEAYARLPAAVRDEFRLLLVGIQGPALDEFRREADGLRLGDRAVVEGYCDEADLPALLSGAAALCFPSRSEGFGLPILDAFVCRTPVVAGNRTSLPEVAGDAALLVDPEDVDAIRDGMLRIVTDAGLRGELIARGAERAKQFTWERTADTVAGVFEAVAGGGA